MPTGRVRAHRVQHRPVGRPRPARRRHRGGRVRAAPVPRPHPRARCPGARRTRAAGRCRPTTAAPTTRSSPAAWALGASERLRVGIGVCLVPARDPIVLAKQVASLDVMSGGRFVLGVGAGWNAEEIADHGVSPASRWAVMRERVLAMRAIWTEDEAEFHGDHVSFEPLWSWPKPVQRPGPPIMVGGHGDGVIDRVVEYGDEWLVMPSPGRPPLRRAHRRCCASGPPPPAGPARRCRASSTASCRRRWSRSWWTAASSASTWRCRTGRPSRWSTRSAGSARRSRAYR